MLWFAGISVIEEQKFVKLINAANDFNLSEDIVEMTIEIRKQYKTKLPDAIIAATALSNGLCIITRNTKDFERVEGLKVVHSHKM